MPNTTNFNWATPADTDLVKDGALAIRTLGNSIDTSLVDLKGGTTGQVLSKTSNTDMDFTWVAADDVDAIQKSLIDAEGDLIVGDAADAVQRLAIGSNGNVLTVDTAVDGKIKWAAPAGGGKVLQVVNGNTTTETSITSSSLTDTTITATITPSAATSKIAIFISANSRIQEGGQTDIYAGAALLRGATIIQDFDQTDGFWQRIGGASGTLRLITQQAVIYLDSPNTTSATTYKLQARVISPLTTINFQKDSVPSNILLMEIGA